MNLERCEVGECEAKATITYLDHGVCQDHWNQLTAEEASPDALRNALGIEVSAILPMEETMTVPKAGARRGKRSEYSKAPAKEKTPQESKPKKDKDARGESQVVFAFRLAEADRDRIHEAAGPGKATQFVRAAALAAATADTKAFEQLVTQAKANLK